MSTIGGEPLAALLGVGSIAPPGAQCLTRRTGTGIRITMITTELSSILSGTRQPSATDWFRDLQTQAWDTFEAEPLPVRTNELWRFSSVKNLSLDGYVVAPDFSEDLSSLTRAREFMNPAGRINFANETVLTSQQLDPALKWAGVIFTTLSQALEEH